MRRSDQGKGALEPDIVIQGYNWWLELQHAQRATPFEKLLQAERDCSAVIGEWRPVAITKQTRGSIKVTMRVSVLLHLLGFYHDIACRIPVTISYSDFLESVAAHRKTEMLLNG